VREALPAAADADLVALHDDGQGRVPVGAAEPVGRRASGARLPAARGQGDTNIVVRGAGGVVYGQHRARSTRIAAARERRGDDPWVEQVEPVRLRLEGDATPRGPRWRTARVPEAQRARRDAPPRSELPRRAVRVFRIGVLVTLRAIREAVVVVIDGPTESRSRREAG